MGQDSEIYSVENQKVKKQKEDLKTPNLTLKLKGEKGLLFFKSAFSHTPTLSFCYF